MPSQARIVARDNMLPEVGRIVEAHTELRKGCRGRDTHISILRGSILLLCATWEVYCESVLEEAVNKILKMKSDPYDLPKDMQSQLIAAVHDPVMIKSQPLKLAGIGWRAVYEQEVSNACARFNTPKSDRLNDLFKKWLGMKVISDCWSCGSQAIDEFVSLRGEIAHRGGDAQRVSRDDVTRLKAMITRSILETDDAIYKYLKSPDLLGVAPWQKTTKL